MTSLRIVLYISSSSSSVLLFFFLPSDSSCVFSDESPAPVDRIFLS